MSTEYDRYDGVEILAATVSRRALLRTAGGLALASITGGCDFNGQEKKTLKPDIQIERREVLDKTDLLTYKWHVAGTRQDRSGALNVTPVNLAVGKITDDENEDQSRLTYIPNIPMHAYGPYLEAQGEFGFQTDVKLDPQATFTLQMGELPREYDDFLVMQKALRLTIAHRKLQAQTWDGIHQQPITKEFDLPDDTDHKAIALTCRANEIIIEINGSEVATVAHSDIFSGNNVWLGIAATDADCRVSKLEAHKLESDRLHIADASTLQVTKSSDRLSKKAKIDVGTAVSLGPLVSDAKYAQAIGEFSVMTTENALKPRNTQPTEGVFTFEAGDALVDFATRHGQEVWGHTTVWYKELPQWMNELPTDTEADKERVKQVMIDHIEAVVSHYRGKIKSWDIVNEILAHDSTDLRENLWYKAMGADYIEIALRAAKEADPEAEFWINEYALDKDAEKDEARFQSILEFAIPLQKQGLLHGIAFQGHVYEIPRDTMSPDAIKRRTIEARKHGLEVRISEMDVTPEVGRDVQTKHFGEIARIARELKIDFAVWGVGGLYVSTSGLDGNNFSSQSHLLFDDQLNPTPAYYAVKKAIS